MTNWLAPGVAAEVACSVMVLLVPSGSVRLNWTESPSFGFGPKATVMVLGEPAGCVTVAPVRVELTPASLNPNGEPATSSLIETVDPTDRRDHQPAEPAGAEVGLVALGDHLLEAGEGTVAVEDVVGGFDRLLVRRAPREQVIVADLGVEQAEDLIELVGGARLQRRLPTCAERERRRLLGRPLHRCFSTLPICDSAPSAMPSVVVMVVLVSS